jgi:microsomal dipeptidase-like Zn-dependent dipeptidase
MSDTDMIEINNEMYHIFKTGALVDYTSWDATVEPHKPYDGKLNFIRTKAGGTRISCAIEYVNQNFKKNGWKFAVIGTDG